MSAYTDDSTVDLQHLSLTLHAQLQLSMRRAYTKGSVLCLHSPGMNRTDPLPQSISWLRPYAGSWRNFHDARVFNIQQLPKRSLNRTRDWGSSPSAYDNQRWVLKRAKQQTWTSRLPAALPGQRHHYVNIKVLDVFTCFGLIHKQYAVGPGGSTLGRGIVEALHCKSIGGGPTASPNSTPSLTAHATTLEAVLWVGFQRSQGDRRLLALSAAWCRGDHDMAPLFNRHPHRLNSGQRTLRSRVNAVNFEFVSLRDFRAMLL